MFNFFKKTMPPEDQARRLHQAELRLDEQLAAKTAELEAIERDTGGAILRAALDGKTPEATGRAATLRAEIDDLEKGILTAREERRAVLHACNRKQAAELREKASELRKQAASKEAETLRMIAALEEREGVPFMVARPQFFHEADRRQAALVAGSPYIREDFAIQEHFGQMQDLRAKHHAANESWQDLHRQVDEALRRLRSQAIDLHRPPPDAEIEKLEAKAKPDAERALEAVSAAQAALDAHSRRRKIFESSNTWAMIHNAIAREQQAAAIEAAGVADSGEITADSFVELLEAACGDPFVIGPPRAEVRNLYGTLDGPLTVNWKHGAVDLWPAGLPMSTYQPQPRDRSAAL